MAKIHTTLNNIGDHIDISRGPMIASTSLVGRCSIASVRTKFKSSSKVYLII